MSDEKNNAIEALEKLKDVIKHQYDFYKHMTTINAGSILIIIALLEGVFKEPKRIEIVIISILSFVLSLICSLTIMSKIGNLILKLTSIHVASITQEDIDINKISDEIHSACKQLTVIDDLHSIFFFLGIGMLAYFAIYNFLLAKC